MLDSKRVWPRGDHWKSLPGQGPVWSQKSDAINAIKYAALHAQGTGVEPWCDAITFGQDEINIWINGTQITLTAKRPVRQRDAPIQYAPNTGGHDEANDSQETGDNGRSPETPEQDASGLARR